MEHFLKKSVVIGSGVMGHGISQLLAQHGVEVRLVDVSRGILEQARDWIRDNLSYLVELELLERSKVNEILERITFTTDLPGALPGAKYVVEVATENLEVKAGIWKMLSDHADPDAILASNTSSYDINELARGVAGPERIIGTHWFHPPPITPCVEVIPGEGASRENIDWTLELLTRLGKAPTLCRSAPGFVANRIQMAMAKEALTLVEEGLATPAEIDRIVTTSIGFRLGAFGPIEIADMAGLDTYQSIYQYLDGKLAGNRFKPPEILAEMSRQGRLGLKCSAGFYDYPDDSANEVRRKRDRMLYRRLALYRSELELEHKAS